MPPNILQRTATTLRDAAMAYPEAHEAFPWGEVAIKVNNKVFLFMYNNGETLSLSCKLPQSGDMALMLPFAKPTGYGLGKSGWVSANFTGKEEPPVELLRAWIDESYRAVAPKKLVAGLGGETAEERAGKSTKAVKTGAGAASAPRSKRIGGVAEKAATTGSTAAQSRAARSAKTGSTAARAAKTGSTAAKARAAKTGSTAAKSRAARSAKTEYGQRS